MKRYAFPLHWMPLAQPPPYKTRWAICYTSPCRTFYQAFNAT